MIKTFFAALAFALTGAALFATTRPPILDTVLDDVTYSAGLEALGVLCDPTAAGTLERLRKLAEDAATVQGYGPETVLDARERGVAMAKHELSRFAVDCENIRDRVGIWQGLSE